MQKNDTHFAYRLARSLRFCMCSMCAPEKTLQKMEGDKRNDFWRMIAEAEIFKNYTLYDYYTYISEQYLNRVATATACLPIVFLRRRRDCIYIVAGVLIHGSKYTSIVRGQIFLQKYIQNITFQMYFKIIKYLYNKCSHVKSCRIIAPTIVYVQPFLSHLPPTKHETFPNEPRTRTTTTICVCFGIGYDII